MKPITITLEEFKELSKIIEKLANTLAFGNDDEIIDVSNSVSSELNLWEITIAKNNGLVKRCLLRNIL